MKRIIAFLIIFALLITGVYASVLGSETVFTTEIPVADGVSYTKNIFYSDQSGVGNQTEFFYEYTPQQNIVPVITNGGSVYGKQKISDEIKRLKDLGFYPVMAMNADFFSFQTGVPMSNLIMNGEVVSKDSTYKYGVGFYSDGSAFIAPMQIHTTLRIDDSEDLIPIYNINKYPQPYAIYMLNSNYAATTTATKRSVNVIIGEVEGELKIGETITGVVEEVAITDKQIDIPAEKLVLVVDVYAPEDVIEQISRFAPGQKVTIETTCNTDERFAEAAYAMGCTGGLLIEDGKIQDLDESAAPRTAIGIKEDGTVIFYAIDGRHSGHSYGARLKTLSQRLLELGCTYAVNLDGGGSTSVIGTMPGIGETQLLNRPSDGGERSVSTFISLMNTSQPDGELHALNLYPGGEGYLVGARENILIYGRDKNGYPVTVEDAVTLTASGGEIDGTHVIFKEEGKVIVEAEASSGATGKTEFVCFETPTEIVVKNEANNKQVTKLTLRPGETVKLTATSSAGHIPLISADNLYTWNAEEKIGVVDNEGTFTAGENICDGKITVSAGEKTESILVSVDDGDIYETKKYPTGEFEQVEENIVFTVTNADIYNVKDYKGEADGETVEAELQENKIIIPAPADGMHKISVEVTNEADKTQIFRFTFGEYDGKLLYPDIEENWAKNYISYMSDRKIVNGMDGGFNPSGGVTRIQFAVMIGRMLGLSSEAVPEFADVDTIPQWGIKEAAALTEKGIISGKTNPDGTLTFNPSDTLTRAEAAAIISRILNDNLLKCDIEFEDKEDIPDWAYESFKTLTALKIMSGYPDGTLKPLNGITRAEAVKILYEIY